MCFSFCDWLAAMWSQERFWCLSAFQRFLQVLLIWKSTTINSKTKKMRWRQFLLDTNALLLCFVSSEHVVASIAGRGNAQNSSTAKRLVEFSNHCVASLFCNYIYICMWIIIIILNVLMSSLLNFQLFILFIYFHRFSVRIELFGV